MDAHGRRRLAAAIVLGAVVCVVLVLLATLGPLPGDPVEETAATVAAEPAEPAAARRRVDDTGADRDASSGHDGATREAGEARLPRICRLDVRVLRETDDAALPGAAVVHRDASGNTWSGTTDEGGTAVLRDVSWSWGRVRVTAADHAAAEAEVTAIPLGGRRGIAIRLRPALPLRVVVRDAWTGDPVAFARVGVFDTGRGGNVWEPDASPGPLLAEATTAEDGRALLAGVPGGACIVRVTGDRLETTDTGLRRGSAPDPAETVTLWTSRGGSVVGRVQREDGTPLANARVRLGWGRATSFRQAFTVVDSDGRNLVLPGRPGPTVTELWRPLVATAGDDGRYRIDGVRRGPPFFVHATDALDRPVSERTHLRLARGQDELVHDVVARSETDAEHVADDALELPDMHEPIGDAVVTGRVVDAGGEGAADVRVWIAGATHATYAEDDGRFEIRGLPPGGVTVRAQTASGEVVSVKAAAPQDGIVLRLPEPAAAPQPEPGTSVTLRVAVILRGDGPPPSAITIFTSVAVTSVGWSGTARRAEIAVTLPRAPAAGRRAASIAGLGVWPWHAELPAARGGVIDLGEVTLDTGGVVHGVVVDDLGAPVAGARVSVNRGRNPETSSLASATVAGSDGSFVAGGLVEAPDQAYHASAAAPRHAHGSATFELEGGRADVRVVLRRLVGVRVIVRDEEGLPIQGVHVRSDHLRDDTPTTDRAGAMEVWLPPGRHSVRAYDPTTATLSAPHVVELTLGNASTEIALTIPRGTVLEQRRK